MSRIVRTTHLLRGEIPSTRNHREYLLKSPGQPSWLLRTLCYSIATGEKDWDGWYERQLKRGLIAAGKSVDTEGTLTAQAADDLHTIRQASGWLAAHFREGPDHLAGAAVFREQCRSLTPEDKAMLSDAETWEWRGREEVKRDSSTELSSTTFDEGRLFDPSRTDKLSSFHLVHDPSAQLKESEPGSTSGARKLDADLLRNIIKMSLISRDDRSEESEAIRVFARKTLLRATHAAAKYIKHTKASSSYRYENSREALRVLLELHEASTALLTTGNNPATRTAAVQMQGEDMFWEMEERTYDSGPRGVATLQDIFKAPWRFRYRLTETKTSNGQIHALVAGSNGKDEWHERSVRGSDYTDYPQHSSIKSGFVTVDTRSSKRGSDVVEEKSAGNERRKRGRRRR